MKNPLRLALIVFVALLVAAALVLLLYQPLRPAELPTQLPTELPQ